MRRRLPLLLIPTAALLCTLPLLRDGPSCGHDFDFHLVSWLEAARQFRFGNLHPHWTYTPAYGAGEPRFVFYPPLSWTLGALLTLLLQHLPFANPGQAFAFAPILYTFLTLTSAGLAMYALARRYTAPASALLAATLYLANPYTLFTAYQRTAFAELLAATWLPLLLLAILPPPDHQPPSPNHHRSTSLLALSLALLWLTNAPAAVIGSYTLALVAGFRLLSLFRTHRSLRALRKPAASLLLGSSLGLALAAFYIVPAAYERRWVQIDMATIPGMRIADNTLFHQTGDTPHDDVLETASDIALTLLSTTAVALLIATLRTRRRAPTPHPSANPQPPQHSGPATIRPLLLLALLTVTIAFLLTPISVPLWTHIPELAFLQFPWRTLALLAPLTALALALALDTLPLRVSLALALLLPAGLAFAAYTTFREVCDGPDTPAAQLALFQSPLGSDPTDEYTPTTADNDALKQENPRPPKSPGPTPFQTLAPHEHIHLHATGPRQLVLNLRDYPAWSILRNGIPIPEHVPRDDGLLAFDLPPGDADLDLRYATTPDGIAGDAISAAALFLLALTLRRRNPTTPARPRTDSI